MLKNLHIRNLALIREADVDFGPGLNILTGETGAGKSVIVDAIGLALGERISRELKGDESALSELVFEISDSGICDRLRTAGTEPEDGEVFVSRKMQQGRSKLRVNGETKTAAEVRNIASYLLDIHGQSEHQKLLRNDMQLKMLDHFGADQITPALKEYESAYHLWKKLGTELADEEMTPEERARQLSFYEYEINEIEEASLKEGEDELLEKKYRKLLHARKIAEAVDEAHGYSGYDDDGCAGEGIGNALKKLESVISYDEKLDELYQSLSEVESLLADFNRELSSYADSLTFEEEEFRETEERLDLINHLKSKYGNSISRVLEAYEEKKEAYKKLADYEENRKKLKEEFEKASVLLNEKSGKLTALRKETARVFAEKARAEFEELNFAQADFDILFSEPDAPSANGNDLVEFVISTNPGQPKKPLREVVSGGELSRLMLGIRSLFADTDSTETVIFDEIDAGISGRTAQKVAERLQNLARRHQVLCITHLPQIAAMADAHYCISKEISDNTAETKIEMLDDAEAEKELARLIGGAVITENTLKSAREMKFLCRQFKSHEL